MLIEIVRDPSSDLTSFICNGEITPDEIISSMIKFYQGIDGPPTKKVLWDLSNADIGKVSIDNLEDIAQLRLNNDSEATGGKTAIVAPKDLNFGLARMFQAKTVGTQRNLMVFRLLDEATEWLGKKNE